MKDIHNYFFGQMPEMPWRKKKMFVEDYWTEISNVLDLNLVVEDNEIKLVVYPVKDGETNTEINYVIFSMNIDDVKEMVKKEIIEHPTTICSKCQSIIYPWDSGCQNCLKD